MEYDDDVRILKKELRGLFDHIQRIRQEIAAIRRPGAADDRFVTMSDQLDAIVQNTETATNTIMENAEGVDEVIRGVRSQIKDEAIAARLDEVPDMIGGIFEACSFQDITGQRITKVVKTLQYIERRVNSLISIWGEDALNAVEPVADGEAPSPANDEAHLLEGPQLKGHGVNQNEVDALLNGGGGNGLASQGDIDALFGGAPTPQPAAAPAPTPKPAPAAPKPAAPAAKQPAKAAAGPGMGQDDIDKLFG